MLYTENGGWSRTNSWNIPEFDKDLQPVIHRDTLVGIEHLRMSNIRNGHPVSNHNEQGREHTKYWNARMSELALAIFPLLKGEDGEGGSTLFQSRYEIIGYVDKCEAAGYCSDLNTRQAVARRFIAGKRKVSPPFTRTRKNAAIKKRKALSLIPEELMEIMKEVVNSPQGTQFKGGNEKALNAMVGMTLKRFKYDAAAVKETIINLCNT